VKVLARDKGQPLACKTRGRTWSLGLEHATSGTDPTDVAACSQDVLQAYLRALMIQPALRGGGYEALLEPPGCRVRFGRGLPQRKPRWRPVSLPEFVLAGIALDGGTTTSIT
jgi:hypothetical protein